MRADKIGFKDKISKVFRLHQSLKSMMSDDEHDENLHHGKLQ